MNAETGLFTFEGRSIPEDSAKFYSPILEWLREYFAQPAGTTQFVVKLEYFNSSSLSCLLELLSEAEKHHLSGSTSVNVEWHFEDDDDDVRGAGEDLEGILKIPFSFKSRMA